MIKITGASDDLIELYGDIEDEIGHHSDEPLFLGFSDGTLVSVKYDENGIWRCTILSKGKADFKHLPGDIIADTNDVLILDEANVERIHWTVVGNKVIKGSKK